MPPIRFLAKEPDSAVSDASNGVSIWDRVDLQPNAVLQKMYHTGKVEDAAGKSIKYGSGISPLEGYFLYDLVLRNEMNKVLEVGMAFGTSALYICQAMRDRKGRGSRLISIDPNQDTQWHSIGLLNIDRAGLSSLHRWIKSTSDLAMAELVARGEAETFDLIFIDGMHLFDYTIVDIFFADKLLRVGGVLVIDDIKHRGVGAAFAFMKSNYKHFQHKPIMVKSMAMFVKTGRDEREWNFHTTFSGGGAAAASKKK